MKVRVHTETGAARDEVFITSSEGESYVNRVVYAKPGIFKDGESYTVKQISDLEQRSEQLLASERQAGLRPQGVKPAAPSEREGD